MVELIKTENKRWQKYQSICELLKSVQLLDLRNCVRSLPVLASKTFDTQRNFKCMYLKIPYWKERADSNDPIPTSSLFAIFQRNLDLFQNIEF